jgi:hypothetical protein
MATDIIIAYNTNTNETITLNDSTDYATLGINITDVNGIRYLFATYNSILNASVVNALVANTEYIVESGTVSINGNSLSFTVGETFVAYEALNISAQSCVVKETGYFCMPNNTIPSTQISNSYTPSQIGEGGDTFADALRKVRYEIFTTLLSVSVSNGLYLVNGTQNDYIITNDGEKIYVGQVYNVVVGVNDGFTAYGNAYPVKYNDTSTTVFWTDYNAQQVKKGYNLALSNPTYNISEDFRANYMSCVSALSMPYVLSYTGANYSESDIQNALDYINGILANTNKDIRNA